MLVKVSVVIGFTIAVVLITCVSCEKTCPSRYKGSFNVNDFKKNRAIIGRSYKNVTVTSATECFSLCLVDCKCQSYQLYAAGRRCELVDVEKNEAAEFYVSVPGYQYYRMKQERTEGRSKNCAVKNGCCKPSPCLNEGECFEVASKWKFRCVCKPDFTGRICEVDLAAISLKCLYTVTMTSGDKHRVVCDTASEPGMKWSLIESFSMNNSLKYQTAAFTDDLPSSKMDLTDYRLPLTVMQYLRSRSTHWRVTCNFQNFLESGTFDKSYYLKGLLNDVDILTYVGRSCVKVLECSISLPYCTNCTVHLRQEPSAGHPHVNVVTNIQKNCSSVRFLSRLIRTATEQIDGDSSLARKFGFYNTLNPIDACAATTSSTTQWWIGGPV